MSSDPRRPDEPPRAEPLHDDQDDPAAASWSERDPTSDDAHVVVPSQRRATDLGRRVVPPPAASRTDRAAPDGDALVAGAWPEPAP